MNVMEKYQAKKKEEDQIEDLDEAAGIEDAKILLIYV